MKDQIGRTRVIIFGHHFLNTLGQVRSFGEIGCHISVVWVENIAHTPKGSNYIDEFVSVKDFDEGLNYILSNYKEEGRKHFLSTDSDAIVSLFDKRYDDLKDYFYFFNAGKQGRLSFFMPKQRQCELAKKYSLNVPKTELARWGELPQNIKFPIFTKAPDCFGLTWKEESQICHNKEELIAFYSKDEQKNSTILLQEFIDKENEVAIEGVSLNGGEILFVPIQGEYLRLPQGAYGTLKRNSPFMLGEKLKSCIQGMIKEIGYTGVFELEFLRNPNKKLYFLEINFRHTQYNHALTDMGANLSEIWMRNVSGEDYDLEGIRVKGSSVVINESRDYRYFVKTGQISLFKWLKDLAKADSYYLFDKKDWFFCLRYYARTLELILSSLAIRVKNKLIVL